ncbi:MAG: phosphoglycerate dehydrogenase [Zetaproteobacteria bacterium]|nr:MAG: phosphoglycerate dehydrogenase [Zetaproteobacteria bacterium]
MPKVWIADKMSERAIEVFNARGIEVDYRPGLSDAEKLAIAGAYDGIAVRSATTLKGALLEAAKRVKVIGRAGIGVDNIDVEQCSRRGIVVMNTPFGNTITTAELAVAHIVAAARMIAPASASTKAGKWEKSRFMGMELTGKKAGVIGAGNIGAIVCNRLRGLQMSVYVYDPFISDERAESLGVTKVDSVAELAEMVDVLTIHVPLLEATRHMINADILKRMKKGAILVNCARGGIVDERALYEACASGHLRAAGLDVYEQEPARDNPLFELENVTCTPHIGASTDEAQENVAVQIAEQMADYLLHGTVINAVNVPSLSEEEQRQLAPYMLLARRMGEFMGQSMRPGYARVTISFEGQAASINRKPLINTVLRGLLSQSFEEVNEVNAAMLARDRGIEIVERANEQAGNFSTLIRLEVEGDEGHRCVSGTLFDETRPRLVSFDTCEVEVAPEGNIIFLQNEDRPGVIAAVGTVLAEAGINIADFRLGRREDGPNAVALVRVDTRPSSMVLDRLASLEHVLMVRYVELGGQ